MAISRFRGVDAIRTKPHIFYDSKYQGWTFFATRKGFFNLKDEEARDTARYFNFSKGKCLPIGWDLIRRMN